MIREAAWEDLAGVAPTGEAAVKIRALWEAYGNDAPFLRFWLGDHGEAIALMDGQAILLCNDDQYNEELLWFVSMQPEIRTVRTDAKTAEWLSVGVNGRLETGVVMQPSRRFDEIDPLVQACTEREVYPLLECVFGTSMPPFDAWYVDVSHRRRHGCCRLVGIKERGEVVAAAMTVAECQGHGLIGAVATALHARGKGYASACVSALTHFLQAEDKHVWLSPKNEKARQLYRRLGFVSVGTWGNVHIGKE